MPVLVTTLTIIIVFFPIVFLTGTAKYLFSPLALVVSLAMIGSRLISMTLVPIMAAALFKAYSENDRKNGFLGAFDRGFHRLTGRYARMMDTVLRYRWGVVGTAAILFVVSMWGFSKVGIELFPKMDVGQISIDVGMESGTRIENSEATITAIENFIRQKTGGDLNLIIANIGVLKDWLAAYTNNSGTEDASVSVQLKEGHQQSTFDYVQLLRTGLKEKFPGVQFIFNTGGIVTAALNFGLPSPIDIQVNGNDLQKAHEIGVKVRDMGQQVEGTEDVTLHQRYDNPEIKLAIDRTKAAELGIDADNIVKNTVSALNSSVNFKPSFWVDEKNGNHYFVGVTYPETELDNPQSVENIAITGTGSSQATLLKNIAKT